MGGGGDGMGVGVRNPACDRNVGKDARLKVKEGTTEIDRYTGKEIEGRCR